MYLGYYGLHEALRIVLEDGLDNRFARHRKNHLALKAGVEAQKRLTEIERIVGEEQ